MTPSVDPYRVLGLTPGASLNEIRSAYRRLAKQYHPDAAGERALPRFLAIQAAYERLVDGEGRLRQDPLARRAPSPRWSADPDRARATRDAYRARRQGWTTPGSAGSAGPTDGRADGPRRRAADGAGPRPGTEWATRGERPRRDEGAPPPGAEPGTRRRKSSRKATPGSTTYDEAAETPFDPEWEGAGWYGPASGTYWTINPREYADPRKHGPEYQARARRAAEVEAQRARRRTRGDPLAGTPDAGSAATDPLAPPAGSTPETEAAGAAAGWAWTGEGSRPGEAAGTAGTTTDAGAGDWSAEAWRYEPEVDYGPSPSARAAASRAPGVSGADAGDLPDLEALLAQLGPRSLREIAGRGDVRSRVVLALLAWPPLGFAAASMLDSLTGCAVFSPSCTEAASMLSVAAQPLIVAALVLLPLLAAITAFASVATLVVALPLAAALSALVGPDVAVGRGVLIVAAIGAYFVGLVGAVVRVGRAGPRSAKPPPAAGSTT